MYTFEEVVFVKNTKDTLLQTTGVCGVSFILVQLFVSAGIVTPKS